MDWNSNILWGIIGLVGGFIISFVFYKIGTKSKKIIYTQNSQILISDNLSKIDGLDITYQNQPIDNLTTTTVSIKSIGKDTIEMNDFGKATPLCIKTTGEFLLKHNEDSIITYNSNPNNLITPKLQNSKTILLDFDYLSQGDTITFVLLHTENLHIDGKLKAGTIMKKDLFKKLNAISDILLSICYSILVFLIGIGYILSIELTNGLSGLFINLGSFLLNLFLGIILIKYFKKLNNIQSD